MWLWNFIINFIHTILQVPVNETIPEPKHITKPIPKDKNPPASARTTVQTIVIDPGHGGNDPGTVYVDPSTNSSIVEKHAALAISLTLKYLLTKRGWKVYLTRTDDTRPAYSERTNLPGNVDADAFISIHFNMPHSYGLVYYAAEKDRPESKKLAKTIDSHMGFNKLWPSTSSRFGRLYIDNVRYDIPSVLVEVDSIENYQNTKQYRLEKAQQIMDALVEYFGEKNANE